MYCGVVVVVNDEMFVDVWIVDLCVDVDDEFVVFVFDLVGGYL